jgi:hypothetical protein|tara:strand:- start:85 stop:498 length:414 start_codon:yes stop_codon:yes gene_type:complete
MLPKPSRKTQAQIDTWTADAPEKKKGPGRPKKGEKAAVKRVGRPSGQRAAQLELQEYMYSHKSKKQVVEKLFSAALDDDHKNQGVAWKLLADRMLPVSGFEKLAGKSAIQININTLSAPQVIKGDTFDQAQGDVEEA